MKIQCDVCENGEASVFCTADEAALCDLCDHKVHHANKLASKHQRFSLLHPSAAETALCDVCRERRAFLFCQQDRAILCRECDHPIHSANELTQKHNRFLLTGIKLSANAAVYTPPPSDAKSIVSAHRDVSIPPPKPLLKKSAAGSASSTTCTPSVRKNAPTTMASALAVAKGGENVIPIGGGVSTSSISEYLMETLPGWHFEDFLDSSAPHFGFSKPDDGGLLFLDGDPDSSFGSFPSESLELWVPQGPPPLCPPQTMNGVKETKELGVNIMKVNRMWADDGFTVPQMSPQPSGFKRSRPFW